MRKHFVKAGRDCNFQEGCVVGMKLREDSEPVRLGKDACIRAGTIIYADVQAGDGFQTGHHTLIHEKTVIGNNVVIGSNTVVGSNVAIGDFVRIGSNCHINAYTQIDSQVFIGPNVILPSGLHLLYGTSASKGAIIGSRVIIDAGAIIYPWVRIGHDTIVEAGSVVFNDVPPYSLVSTSLGQVRPLITNVREILVYFFSNQTKKMIFFD